MNEQKNTDFGRDNHTVDEDAETYNFDPIDIESTEATSLHNEDTTVDDTSPLPNVRSVHSETVFSPAMKEPAQPSSRRFLAAYITSILSGLSLLWSGAFLGYRLLDHFLAPEANNLWSSYFDFAPLYLALITSMIVFGTLYLLTSQYVARQTAKDSVGVRDWRAYRVVYAGFTAVLLVVAASILGSLIYVPLAIALVVQDYASHEIWIQVLGGLHALLWIGVLIWQERLVKRGKNVALQGVATVALVIVVVLLTSIFLVAGKTDERYDKRVSSDLSAIESAISSYKSKNSGELPATLDSLDFTSSPLVEKRLSNYKYTVKQSPSDSATAGQSGLFQQQMMIDEESIYTENYDDMDMTYQLYSQESRSDTARAGYELCATFRTEVTQDRGSPLGALLGASGSSSSFYEHKAGEVCFERN